uniref:Uncharacterized protein n=1 Tax=Daphnia galeata TaxID=27404 RepID=A0A8J2RAF1_9CRUS|nr:unnamed protein product [Daphnia galeata]
MDNRNFYGGTLKFLQLDLFSLTHVCYVPELEALDDRLKLSNRIEEIKNKLKAPLTRNQKQLTSALVKIVQIHSPSLVMKEPI